MTAGRSNEETTVYQPYFHIGILVRDVDAAAAEVSDRLGVEFEPVRTAAVATGETMRYRMSLQGSPYVELVEMVGTGIWAPDQGEGLHHIGFADPDLPGRCDAFASQVDTVVTGDGGVPRVIFTRPDALRGVRVEYLDNEMVEAIVGRLRDLSSARPADQ
jgi:hypothetical protein